MGHGMSNVLALIEPLLLSYSVLQGLGGPCFGECPQSVSFSCVGKGKHVYTERIVQSVMTLTPCFTRYHPSSEPAMAPFLVMKLSLKGGGGFPMATQLGSVRAGTRTRCSDTGFSSLLQRCQRATWELGGPAILGGLEQAAEENDASSLYAGSSSILREGSLLFGTGGGRRRSQSFHVSPPHLDSSPLVSGLLPPCPAPCV